MEAAQPQAPRRRDRGLPPGPRRLPLLGNLLTVPLRRLNDLGELARRYGPVFSVRLGGATIVVLASAEAIHELCVVHAASCSARPRFLNTDVISGGGRSTLLGSGEAWMSRRSLLMHSFLQPAQLPALVALANDEFGLIMRRLDRPVQTVRVFDELLGPTRFDLIARMITASDLAHDPELAGPLRLAVEAEARHFGPRLTDFLPPLRPWVRRTHLRPLTAQLGAFRAFFAELTRRREHELSSGATPSGVLDSLIVHRGRLRAGGGADRVDQHCGDQSMPYMIYNLFGTMNPTHITVMSALWLLLHHPSDLAEVRAELDRVLGPFAGAHTAVTAADLDQLEYLDAAVQETMRLRPPTPSLVPRLVTQDIVTSHGYRIPAGAILMANIATAGHDGTFWEDPHTFRAQRFLRGADGTAPATRRSGASYYLPFGTGPRACPARRLGTTLVKLWLTHLLWRFDVGLTGAADATVPGNREPGRAHIFNAMPVDFGIRLTRRAHTNAHPG